MLYSIAVSTKNGQDDVFTWAARKGSLATIHQIMNYAPKGYFNCVYGETAIREAAGTGQTEIIRWLLDSGVDPYCTRTRSDVFNVWAYTHGAPPLLIAARSGHTEAAELLLDVVTDFDYVRSQEESPVIGFVLKKQTALLESILRRGIDVDQRDIHGQTALFYAVLDESISCVRLLLEFGADINASSSHQFTPLYAAADSGLGEAVELLLQRGTWVDMMADGSQTSLHAAISQGRLSSDQAWCECECG
jgi:ankyrin repeat protein